MKYVILAKYGEMALKGLNRFRFENQLVKTIRERIGTGFGIRHMQSTIYIEPRNENADIDFAFEKVKTIFGIASICKAVVCEKNFDDVCAKSLEYFADILPYKTTFKVFAKRADKRFPMTSPEIGRELGHVLLEKFPNLSVNCDSPQYEVHVDIRDTNAYIYGEKLNGAGGLPVGTGGKALLLLSGGIDSPVAGFLTAKRGVEISALYFETPPYTSERAKLKVEQLVEKLENYCGKIEFFAENITRVSEDLKNKCPSELFTVLLRRQMMKIANEYAEKLGCMAIITGESLGQVASQTLEAINCTNAVAKFPVLRPLIGFDKREIIAISEKIGTFEISSQPYEDCCTVFTPKHPSLRPNIAECEKAELLLAEL
ncbi:tRNA 4-thiouridine(8) synthase ThiI [Clostridia bacterium]|nr:tRNA 4-thiouridine(8) synthase ThiI [Clostridia bacterium]